MFSSDKYEKLNLSADTNIDIQYLLNEDNLSPEKINLN